VTKAKRVPEKLLKVVTEELANTKGQDVMVLDLRPLVSFTDYFVLVTGTSDRHVQALADKIHLRLKKDHQLLPLTFEGFETGQWVLLDYGDFVIHIFQPGPREYYALEEFWGDAPRLVVESGAKAKTKVAGGKR
jgi:ribosome-associated protein